MEEPTVKTILLVCDSIIEGANTVKETVVKGQPHHMKASLMAYKLVALYKKLDNLFDDLLMDDTVTSPPEETERLRKEETERRRKEDFDL